MKVVIFANGKNFSSSLLKQKAAEADCIIAADGGFHNCLENNITPDYVVGDLDSFKSISSKTIKETEILKIEEQDTTDMQKALNFAETLKPSRIDIFCSFGKRTDHSLANLLILNSYRGVPIIMYDEFGFFKVLDPGLYNYNSKKGVTISLFTISKLTNIKLKGFLFSLEENSIGPDFIGLSNKISKTTASIKFDKGRLLVYELYG